MMLYKRLRLNPDFEFDLRLHHIILTFLREGIIVRHSQRTQIAGNGLKPASPPKELP